MNSGHLPRLKLLLRMRTDNPTAAIEKIAKEIGAEGEPLLASYLELLLDKRAAGKTDFLLSLPEEIQFFALK